MPHYWDALRGMGNAGDQRMSHEERLAAIAAVRWAGGSGSLYNYSNTNYSALALLVEKLRGKDIGAVIRTDSVEPSGAQGHPHDR